jgi:hypothetical protein
MRKDVMQKYIISSSRSRCVELLCAVLEFRREKVLEIWTVCDTEYCRETSSADEHTKGK